MYPAIQEEFFLQEINEEKKIRTFTAGWVKLV